MTTYTAIVSNGSKDIKIAVESNEAGHRRDLNTIAEIVTGMPWGMFKVREPKRTIKRKVEGWQPVKNATTNGQPWAWWTV